MSIFIVLGVIVAPFAVLGLLAVLFFAVFALTWAVTSVPQRMRTAHGPHGCPCGPCRSFDTAVREACAIAGVGAGLPRDGGRLTGREKRALRGIEADLRNERERAGL